VRRVRLLISELRSIRPGLEAGGPRWPACRGAACSHIIIRLLVRSPLRTKRPIFKVYKSSMSPERRQQVTARAIRYCANNVCGTRST
jgi:hypothetical protein